ncbi:TraI domain-containing protein [Pseudomonas shahriarae]|uniref:TraI domain-containing protein n=1 Tax=Pseudomonas shahriarae TaxID=2745512 RepID=A0A9X4BZH5_9PSED|nr:MobH family relaxase [Pseudomonas shahriarae]MDD1007199.1 TraI domain-containing protein [Pseudomonas shahriarae]
MQLLKLLKGLVTRPSIDAGREGKRSLTINQIQELELEDPELQKYLMRGDEASLKYPPFLVGLPARVPGKFLLNAHAAKVRSIASGIGLPPREFNRLILPVLDSFASFAHMLPASQAHHHRGAGGLLAHSLEVAVHALNACQVTSFDHDRYPAERIKRRDRWNAAAVLAALMHDVGKPLYDLRVTDASAEKIWQPVANSIPEWAQENGVERYFFHWNPNRHDVHKHLSTTMIDRLLSKELRLWLMEAGQDLYFAMVNAIACDDEKSILTALVIKADSTSVEADLRKWGGDASGKSALGIGVPVSSLVVDTMRHLKSIGVWKVNEVGHRVWVIGDGVYVAWVQGVKDITEELNEKGVKAVPRSADALGEVLLDHHILERSPDGSIYWSVFPDLLSDGRPKPIKLKCVRLAASNLLFPFEPVPQSIAGVVGEGEHETRFEANSNTGAVALPGGGVASQTNDPLAAFPAPGANNPVSMAPMFSLGGATVDAFAPKPAAEIFSTSTLGVPDFSAAPGGADPFGNPAPKQAVPSISTAVAPQLASPPPSTSNAPSTPQSSQRTKGGKATLERVAPGSASAPQIKIVGAPSQAATTEQGIVVSGQQQAVVEGIKIGGRDAPSAKTAAAGKQSKGGSTLAGGAKDGRLPKAGETEFSLPVLADDARLFPGSSADEFPSPKVQATISPAVPVAGGNQVGNGGQSDDLTRRNAEYAYNYADIDDDVLELAGMAIPDRSLRDADAEQDLRPEPAVQLGSGDSDFDGPAEHYRPRVSPRPSVVTPQIKPGGHGGEVKMVIPPELAGMDEFGFGDLPTEISLEFLGDLPAGSPISVSLPKGMERVLHSPNFDIAERAPVADEQELHSMASETPLPHLEDRDLLADFDLPVMSSSVMLPSVDLELDLEPDADFFPPVQTMPDWVEESFQDLHPEAQVRLDPPAPAPAPARQGTPKARAERTVPQGVAPGISVSKSAGEPYPEIKVGQPRKPREPLPSTPVECLPLPEESSAITESFNGYVCSPKESAEYEEFLALTPDLSKSLRWYASNIDKTVSMVSYKPNFEFAGGGFVIDDLPKLQKAMWLWDDFTGTMTRKAPKSVMLNCYLGAIFEYLTKGKYRHSLAVAKDQVEAENFRRIATAALALCKESELNGKRVVSIQPRKLSDISNALQVDEPTLKRALIATHQYLLVRNNHVIEIVD